MVILAKDKQKKKGLNREEFGYGFDISADDLSVMGHNNLANKQQQPENKDEQQQKSRSSNRNKSE
ncbi:MAG: hypothetical protein RR595_11220 [Lysinibacillus sp.]